MRNRNPYGKELAARAVPRLGLALALGALLLSVGCKPGASEKKADAAGQDEIPVRVETLAKRPYQRAARAVATLVPWREVSLRAEAPGRVLAIRKEVGDRVKKGELLVQLDGSVAWQSYKAARVGIKQTEVALRLAKINLDRTKQLRASGDLPQAQLDQAQNAFDRARAALEMARAQTAQVGQRLAQFWVRAPFDGVLARRPINVGDYVAPGTSVFTVVEMKRVKVVVGLDPSEGLLLVKGRPATVSVKTIQGAIVRDAMVHLVRPLADAVTRRVEVELVVDNGDLLLKPGVIARVHIPLSAPEQRLLVPADAVVELLGRRFVYVVRAGRAVRLPVKLGLSTANRVEIVPQGSDPVKVGEALITVGVQRLVPGARVKIVTTPRAGARTVQSRAPAPQSAKPRGM